MLRTSAPRSIFRALASSTCPAPRAFQRHGALQTSQLCTQSFKRPQIPLNATRKPISAYLVRHQTTIDRKHEQEVAKQKLKPDPENVSTTSSIHPVFSEVKAPPPDKETDMSASIKADLDTIRDTFNLSGVPKQALYIGLAGVLPYLATSLSTVFCANEINRAAVYGTGYLFNEDTATLLLQVLEPLQVGYGAVIISCLGTIHWGLEWAGYGGYHGYRRYMIGVVAPAVAWPTILLPPTTALIAQFVAFNFLYYADTQATRRGWAPPWYGTYRFVLTFVVGASIVISLIGRGQIAEKVHRLPGPADRMKALGEHYQRLIEEGKEVEEETRRQALEGAGGEEDGGDEGNEKEEKE